MNWNLLPLPLLYLSAFFERGTWRDWLMFFLEGVNQQAQDAVTRAKRLQDL